MVEIIRRRSAPAFSYENPLVSVILPTYNRANILLERALPSVLGQSYTNLEILIVDDGSTDNTEEVVRACNDPRIRLIKCSRQGYRYPSKAIYHWLAGPIEALNVGLKNVSGQWIARIDDDDNWTSDHIEKLLEFARQGSYEFVSSHLEVRTRDAARVVTAFDDKRDMTGIGSTQTWLYDARYKFFLYNINCWRKGYFRNNDTDLQFRFWRAGLKIGYMPLVTAFITPRPGEDFVGSRAYVTNPEKYEDFYSIKSD